ncbi:SDR family NAD(P)-dependent oxidoreductase [Archangium gephyra]|uniref:SDR family NAD(P)-dependent oxidoreductase n=1 Tax=Archangium gephyra TaxID=48 RepID=UPI003B764591
METASGFELNPADARQVEQLLASFSRSGFQPGHVFHLGAFGTGTGEEPTRGFAHMLGLAQGLLAHKGEGSVRLGYVYPLVDGLQPPRHAAVAGFARALGLETPRLSCQTLALDTQAREPGTLARLLLAESASTELEVRYVAGRRHVRELTGLATETPGPSLLRKGGAYLITGGAGGLGLLLAEHLAHTFQARIALAGRGELDAARQQRLERLRAAGAEVVYLRGDVSERGAAFRVVDEAREHLGTLHGVIHAAGVTRDALVVAKVWEQMSQVLGPKVHGTLHLDEACASLPLDFFALFSSTAAITGNVGQSDYAFANAFLDAFAAEREARRARGERHGLTVSFNWPLWAEGGMRVDAQTLRFMERRAGLTPLPTSLGLATFEQGLALGGSQRVVFHGTRDTIVQRLGISSGPAVESPIEARDEAPVAEAPVAPAPRVAVSSTHTAPVREPIALVGMACRFPGGCDSPEALWRFLVQGGDAITPMPPGRWDMDAFYNADPEAAGTLYVRQAGFLREAPSLFDARFFGISPREAAEMDPQQRLLLEVSWEALERAGLAPDGLAGSPVGVFVGMCGAEYGLLPRDARQFGAYTATGVATNIASGRIAHRLGLQGPALTVDTACSSSLMAVHLACDSLLRGESDVALAGGVNLMLSPYTFISLCRLRALAPDGRCKSFDASGDGYGRAEGCGMVVLKRLSDARRDGDPVLAVLLGSAANHDGASSGLTVPNGLAQQALLRKALESARLEPGQVSFVEAHGTGTALGDPIEMQALGAVYGQRRPSEGDFTVGAVKANLGHLEAAAGVAGLIKTVLCLRNQAIPGQVHLREVNPRIRLERLRARLPRETGPWVAERRLAGVSAFGFSGTNVHVLVGEPPAAPAPRHRPRSSPEPTTTASRPVHLLPLSARDERALRELALAWRERLAREDGDTLASLCAAAMAERGHLEHRAALVAPDRPTLLAGLEALAEGREHGSVLRGTVEGGAPRLAFALPHEDGLATLKEALYPVEPVFARAHDESASVAAELLGVSLREVRGPAAAFCTRHALLTLLAHWGYVPDALLADGQGLLTAAHVAGVMEPPGRTALRPARTGAGGRRDAGARPAVGSAPPAAARECRSAPRRPGRGGSRHLGAAPDSGRRVERRPERTGRPGAPGGGDAGRHRASSGSRHRGPLARPHPGAGTVGGAAHLRGAPLHPGAHPGPAPLHRGPPAPGAALAHLPLPTQGPLAAASPGGRERPGQRVRRDAAGLATPRAGILLPLQPRAPARLGRQPRHRPHRPSPGADGPRRAPAPGPEAPCAEGRALPGPPARGSRRGARGTPRGGAGRRRHLEAEPPRPRAEARPVDAPRTGPAGGGGARDGGASGPPPPGGRTRLGRRHLLPAARRADLPARRECEVGGGGPLPRWRGAGPLPP